MPRNYVLVSSASSSDTSLQCSSDYSRSESSEDRRRRRRGCKRRHARSPVPPEPQESVHWWLARWLSSEFAKFASSVLEGGKGCIRYLSNTALRALSSSRTAEDLLEETSRVRRSRRRRNRSPQRPGGSGESFKGWKPRRRQRKSGRGQRERSSSPNEAYVTVKHKKGSKHGHSPRLPATKQVSAKSCYRHPLNDGWMYEENWIESLLKEVKSNFKNPVKVKVYKVTQSDNPGSRSRSDNSQADSKLSFSIEELVSPTYPSSSSNVITTSSKRVKAEAAAPETAVCKGRGENTAGPSTSRGRSDKSPSHLKKVKPPKNLTNSPNPPLPQRSSLMQLSLSDYTLGDVVKDKSAPHAQPPDDTRHKKQPTSQPEEIDSKCGQGVFYPRPGLRCTVVCRDVSSDRLARREDQLDREPIRGRRKQVDGVQGEPSAGTREQSDTVQREPSRERRDQFDGVQGEPNGPVLQRKEPVELVAHHEFPEESPETVVPMLSSELDGQNEPRELDKSSPASEPNVPKTSPKIALAMSGESIFSFSLSSLVEPPSEAHQGAQQTEVEEMPVMNPGTNAPDEMKGRMTTNAEVDNVSGMLPSDRSELSDVPESLDSEDGSFDRETVATQRPPTDAPPQPLSPEQQQTPPTDVILDSVTKVSSGVTKVGSRASYAERKETSAVNLQSVGHPGDTVVVVSDPSVTGRSRTTLQSCQQIVKSITDELLSIVGSTDHEESDESVYTASGSGVISSSELLRQPQLPESYEIPKPLKSNVSMLPGIADVAIAASFANLGGPSITSLADQEQDQESVYTASGSGVISSTELLRQPQLPESYEIPKPLRSNVSMLPGIADVAIAASFATLGGPSITSLADQEQDRGSQLGRSSLGLSSYSFSGASLTSVSKGTMSEKSKGSMASEYRALSTEQRLTFGEVEKLSYSSVITESQFSPPSKFKGLDKTSSKTNLPPIKEESQKNLPPIKEEGEDESSKEVSPIVQQRRASKVTPGVLKRRPQVLTGDSSASKLAVDQPVAELTPVERCPCKKVCDCCTCGLQRPKPSTGPTVPSLSTLGSPSSKDLPKSPLKQPRPRIGPIDYSSKPFPKNSFDVLRSPFFAHWDYYDIDQDHPTARFAKRPDQLELDNVDTILVKNVRVGEYIIPYLKLQTKEQKVSSKMVCNFYKARKAAAKGKVKRDLGDYCADQNSGTDLSVENGEVKRKCQCKKQQKQEDGPTTESSEENVWKDYPRDEQEPLDLMAMESEFGSKCSEASVAGCTCSFTPAKARKIPLPPTPCQSCDCFISDLENDAMPLKGMRSRASFGPSPSSEDRLSVVDKNAVMDEYISELRELCTAILGMIGKMKAIMEETAPKSPDRSIISKQPTLPDVHSANK